MISRQLPIFTVITLESMEILAMTHKHHCRSSISADTALLHEPRLRPTTRITQMRMRMIHNQ